MHLFAGADDVSILLNKTEDMRLHEIIKQIDNHNLVDYEKIQPYRRSIKSYYYAYWCCEPIFMVTFLRNACCFGKIVPAKEFLEAMVEETNNNEDEIENINTNSFFL